MENYRNTPYLGHAEELRALKGKKKIALTL